jgi:hypothetical protein
MRVSTSKELNRMPIEKKTVGAFIFFEKSINISGRDHHHHNIHHWSSFVVTVFSCLCCNHRKCVLVCLSLSRCTFNRHHQSITMKWHAFLNNVQRLRCVVWHVVMKRKGKKWYLSLVCDVSSDDGYETWQGKEANLQNERDLCRELIKLYGRRPNRP